MKNMYGICIHLVSDYLTNADLSKYSLDVNKTFRFLLFTTFSDEVEFYGDDE